MSLLKIPVIIATAFGHHLCTTPPNKAPPKQEHYVPKAGTPVLREIAMDVLLSLSPVLQLIQWVIGLFECIAIYASTYPTSPFAPAVSPYLCYSNIQFSSLTITQPTISFFALSLLANAGYSLRYLSFQYLGSMFTFQLTQRRDHRLITGGPYSFVRHPSYTGGIIGFMGHLGCAFNTHSWLRQSGILCTFGGAAIVGFWAFTMVAIPSLAILRLGNEEEMLHQAFGEEWKKWADRVRYRIIPGIY